MTQRRLNLFTALSFALVLLWMVGFRDAFTAQRASVRIIPALLNMSAGERMALGGGPIYDLAQKVISVVDAKSGSKVYFFNPPVEGGRHYSGRARYFLYPLSIKEVNSGDNMSPKDFRPGDYIVFFIPGEFLDTGFEAALTSTIPLERVYGVTDKKGRRAIYRVTG